jgi:hypothetical protein
MTDRQTTKPDGGSKQTSPLPTGPVGWIARGVGHLLGVSTLSVLLALPLVDRATLELYMAALQDPQFVADWSSLLVHVGLAGCCWALIAIAFHHFRGRHADRADEPTRVVRAGRGSVMLETLIVMIPFLLLTSGLAQLSLRNVAGLLSDLALYQGARTAWVWMPETAETRSPANTSIDQGDVARKARLASAAVLAPTAPSSFTVPQGNQAPELSNLRGTMYATFAGSAATDAGTNAVNDARNSLGTGRSDSTGEALSFASAFDNQKFKKRASRKLTFAYLALQGYQLDIGSRNGNRMVSVRFTYQYNVVFPWFAYIFGDGYLTGGAAPGGRDGYYVGIQRPRPGRPSSSRYMLDRQQPL